MVAWLQSLSIRGGPRRILTGPWTSLAAPQYLVGVMAGLLVGVPRDEGVRLSHWLELGPGGKDPMIRLLTMREFVSFLEATRVRSSCGVIVRTVLTSICTSLPYPFSLSFLGRGFPTDGRGLRIPTLPY